MAADTKQKRLSMINMGTPVTAVLFEVDGAVDADDWYVCLHIYSGISLSAPVAEVPAGASSASPGTGISVGVMG